MTGNSANGVFVAAAETSAKKAENDEQRKSTPEAKNSRRKGKFSKNDNSMAARKAYSRHDGQIEPDDCVTDISSDYLNELKTSYYSLQVVVDAEKRDIIEQETKQQSECKLWKEERIKRITASHVEGIAKVRATTKRSKKVKELLYSTFKGNRATVYGMLMEDTARQKYVDKQQQSHPGLKIEPSGLVVSLDNPWLAASPDGKVNDLSAAQPMGLVEYKNPYSMKHLTIGEACENKEFCLEKNDKGTQMEYTLKCRHSYYYQVQCQMYYCNVEWCDFVVHTEKDLHVERIQQDKDWWEQQLPKLKTFYFDHLLPELASPRHANGGIREPEHPTLPIV